ncbi:MAG: coproporphyrinogen dehydrogenase HemZ [Clostridia bacterium]|nr:coproporphyrinogen dehydrogenase HemZ [Clostridia bacterium]
MKLCLINHSFKYELEKLIRIFLPFEKIEFYNTYVLEDNVAVTEISENKAKASLYLNNELFKNEILLNGFDEKTKELKLATALFNCFCEATGYISQWGLLTGVRPAKLWSRLKENMGENEAESYFKNELLVSNKKVELCKMTNAGEDKIISLSKPNSYSLYISIPFCPTRCSYCSFVSHSVDKAKKLIPEYVDKLCEEIKITSEIANKNYLKLETVYIGGGTPTAIDEYNLEKIMKTVLENFDLSNILEYTVEAGRPDTITAEKLMVIKKYGATRISINPQTMNDKVLEVIGRKHSAEQTVNSFNLARSLGFDNINMDLIAGLPTDNIESFKKTINKVLELNPESVTVHSLSFKRSSNLNFDDKIKSRNIDAEASLMVDFALETLTGNGILPYYMYRQSKTVGNLENVGYAKKGFECLYNVYIMDETHSILACGASAVSKLREPGGNFIDRIFNFKYPYEYIDRFDEIIARKDGINDFYNKYGV